MDFGPIDDDLVPAEAGPFHIAQSDPAEHPGLDRRNDLRISERAEIAVPLQPRFLAIDAAGYVDRQQKFQIGRSFVGRGARNHD